jgi:hypothetical protein
MSIMTNKPGNARVYAVSPGKEPPAWVAERMTTGTINPDGSFDVDTFEGKVTALRGWIIGEATTGHIYCCPPQSMNEKLQALAGKPLEPTLSAKAPVEPAPQPAAAPPAAVQAEVPKPKPTPKLKLLATIGKQPAIEWIKPEELFVDRTYQRDIGGGASQALITSIAAEWDWRLCVSLICSERADGKTYVIDGQHRQEGAELRNSIARTLGMVEGYIAHLPCTVHRGLTQEQEAELFVQANKLRRPVQRLEQFHAALVAGDRPTVEINAIIEEAGLKVGRSPAWQMIKAGEVVFVNSVGSKMKRHGREPVLAALRVLAFAFEGQRFSTAGAMFDALIAFHVKREKEGLPVDWELLGRLVAAFTVDEWREKVTGAGNGFERNAMLLDALVEAYAEADAEVA